LLLERLCFRWQALARASERRAAPSGWVRRRAP